MDPFATQSIRQVTKKPVKDHLNITLSQRPDHLEQTDYLPIYLTFLPSSESSPSPSPNNPALDLLGRAWSTYRTIANAKKVKTCLSPNRSKQGLYVSKHHTYS